jgi:hypothetical protein
MNDCWVKVAATPSPRRIWRNGLGFRSSVGGEGAAFTSCDEGVASTTSQAEAICHAATQSEGRASARPSTSRP